MSDARVESVPEVESESSPIEIPKAQPQRIVYTKDFLMDLKFSPSSLVKPDKLPNLSIIYDEVRVLHIRTTRFKANNQITRRYLIFNPEQQPPPQQQQLDSVRRRDSAPPILTRTRTGSTNCDWKKISYRRPPRPRHCSESAILSEVKSRN